MLSFLALLRTESQQFCMFLTKKYYAHAIFLSIFYYDSRHFSFRFCFVSDTERTKSNHPEQKNAGITCKKSSNSGIPPGGNNKTDIRQYYITKVPCS